MTRDAALILGLRLRGAACAGQEVHETFATGAGELSGDGGGDGDMAADPAAPEGEGVSFADTESRKVIHTASIAIEAEDTRAVYRRVQDKIGRASCRERV